MTEIHIKDRSDLTYRLMLVAEMKRGDQFPPPGFASDDPDWQADGWNVGMSKLLHEARFEILLRRQEVEDLRFIGRLMFAAAVTSTAILVSIAIVLVLR